MSRTDKLRDELAKLELDDENRELVGQIVHQAEHFLTASEHFVRQGQVVELCFFIIPRNGDVAVFMPSVCLQGAPKMSAEQEKNMIANIVRNIASERNAIAVIQIAEAWALDGKMGEAASDADIAFIQEHGVRAHPNSIEIVQCHVSLNCRGQSRAFASSYKLHGKEGTPRTMTPLWDWEEMRSTGRFSVEAMYLSSLT